MSTCRDAASPGPTTMMVAATHTQQTPGRAVASKCQRSAGTIICFRCGRDQGDLVDGLDVGPNGGGVKIVTVRASTLVELLT
jgi:hypothetical protein